jgi:hypothetical protein
MSDTRIVSPRVLVGWVGAAAAIFALSLYVMGLSGGPSAEVGASVFSRSAIGYLGFAELMQRLGLHVVKGPTAMREASEPATLLVVTGSVSSIDTPEKRQALAVASRALFIVPKWTGTRSENHAGWIDEARQLSPSEADWMIVQAGSRGRAARIETPAQWTTNTLGVTPSLAKTTQVITGSELKPIVASDAGILVGERTERGRRVWIVADPDIVANHGLLKGDNAELAMRLIGQLRYSGGSIVFIETPRAGTSGYRPPPSNPLNLLFMPPFVFVTLNGLALVGLLLWATMPRFGKPHPTPLLMAAGKEGLIHNAAHLLAFANYREPIVASYVRATVRGVARRLRAPRDADDAATVAWLDRVARARGHNVDLNDIMQRADTMARGKRADVAGIVGLARDTFRWKREMLGGS